MHRQQREREKKKYHGVISNHQTKDSKNSQIAKSLPPPHNQRYNLSRDKLKTKVCDVDLGVRPVQQLSFYLSFYLSIYLSSLPSLSGLARPFRAPASRSRSYEYGANLISSS